jgi:hypothetical protein
MRISIVIVFIMFFSLNHMIAQRKALIKLISGIEKTVNITDDNAEFIKFVNDEGKVQTVNKSSLASIEYLNQKVVSSISQTFVEESNYPEGQNEDLVETYLMIVGSTTSLNSKITIQIDFGQGISNWKPKKSMLMDADGKPIKFNSMIDALNFLAFKGWIFVDAHTVTTGNQNVYNWIMKRSIPISEITDY